MHIIYRQKETDTKREGQIDGQKERQIRRRNAYEIVVGSKIEFGAN